MKLTHIGCKKIHPNKFILPSMYSFVEEIPNNEKDFKKLLADRFSSNIAPISIFILKTIYSLLKYGDIDFSSLELESDPTVKNIFTEIDQSSLKSYTYYKKQYTEWKNMYNICLYDKDKISVLEFLIYNRRQMLDIIEQITKSDNYKNFMHISYNTWSMCLDNSTIVKSIVNEKDRVLLDNIDIAFNSIIKYFSAQERYTYDDVKYGILNDILGLFVQYYMLYDDEEHINQAFEFWHITGCKKSKNFSANNKNIDRPFIYVGNEDKWMYYYIKFYMAYNNGKYMPMLFKNTSPAGLFVRNITNNIHVIDAHYSYMIPKYIELYNKLKPYSSYPLEYFMDMARMYNHFSSINTEYNKSTGVDELLEFFEQNREIFSLCCTHSTLVSISHWSINAGLQYRPDTPFCSVFDRAINLLECIILCHMTDEQKEKFYKLLAYQINCGMRDSSACILIKAICSINNISTADLIGAITPYLNEKAQQQMLLIYMS